MFDHPQAVAYELTLTLSIRQVYLLLSAARGHVLSPEERASATAELEQALARPCLPATTCSVPQRTAARLGELVGEQHHAAQIFHGETEPYAQFR